MRLRLLSCSFSILFLSVFALADLADAGSRIYRDSEGVPHVYADSNRDLFFGFGYLIGKDRLFQAEMRKRQALGRRAEVLGRTDQTRWANKFVEKDTESRRGLDLAGLQDQVDRLEETDRALLQAYVDGLNQAIGEALANDGAGLPEAFRKYDFEPSLWTILDVVATTADVLAGYSDFSFQDDNLALYRFLAQKYPDRCDDVFEQLLWTNDPYAITTMGDQKQPNEAADPMPAQGCRATTSGMPNGLAWSDDLAVYAQDPDPAFEPKRASMAWAAGRDRAEDARAIFVAGPQTGWHRPSYYYTVGLHGGDFDFIGMAPEAMPVFQVGFNRHYAWGMTAGLGTQSDLFALTLTEDGSAYVRNGEDTAFEQRLEVIEVKDEAAENAIILQSVYGPVVQINPEAHLAYAKSSHWRGHELESIFAWLKASSAQSENEWRGRVRNVAYNYNLFYADNGGNVGFAFTGRFPNRQPGTDPRLPISGDGAHDYVGYTAPQDTPIYITTDTLFNFNNRPTRTWPNSGLFWEQWSRGHQVGVMKDVIDDWPNHVDWNDVWALNRVISETDVNWYPFHTIFAEAVAGLDQDDNRYAAAQAVLNWNGRRADNDGDGYFDAVGLTVFDQWIEDLVSRTLTPTLDGADDAGAGGAAGYFLQNVHQRLPARLEEHPAGGTLATLRAFLAVEGVPGIPNHHDFFAGIDPMDVARSALGDAVESLSEKFDNNDPASWRTATTPQTYFPTNTDRVPMSVTSTLTHRGVFANRGGVNLVVEYGENGAIARAGFANPLGGPEDETVEAPSDFHLDLYANQELAPLSLADEQSLIENDAVLVKSFE